MNKSIWQPMSFTLILPGLGHIIIGKYKTGITTICLLVFLKVFAVYTVLSANFQIYASFSINILCTYIFPLFFCLVLFFPKKNLNNQTAGKDLWLSVFLTLIFPGLGHLYLKKFLSFIFIFMLYLGISFSVNNETLNFILLFLIKIIALLSVFLNHKISKRSVKYFVFFFIFVSIFFELAWPYLYDKYLLIYAKPTGTSSIPTINESDILIGNKLAYLFEPPQIGDFVLFDIPNNGDLKSINKYLAKRIVAKGGDVISYDNKNFYLNGKIVDTEYTRETSEKLCFLGSDSLFILFVTIFIIKLAIT